MTSLKIRLFQHNACYLKVFSLLCLILFSTSSFPFYKKNIDFRDINNQVKYGPSVLNIHYQELPSDGKTIKTFGTIYGTKLSLTKTFYLNFFYLDINAESYRGKLKYNGGIYKRDNKTKQISSTPYRTDDMEEIFRFLEGKLGIILTPLRSVQAIPYISFEYRYWDWGGDRKSHNERASLGALLNWKIADNIFLSPYVAIGKIFASDVHYEKRYYAKSDVHQPSWTYKLDNTAHYKAGLNFYYFFTPSWSVCANLDYAYFDFKKSGTKQDKEGSRWYEPKSETQEVKFALSVGYSF